MRWTGMTPIRGAMRWRRALPEAQDVNFTWEEFVRRNNEELVATWGNLANRVLGFAYKRFDGKVPQPGALDDADRALLDQIEPTFERVTDAARCRQAQAGADRGDGAGARGEPLSEPQGTLEADQDRPRPRPPPRSSWRSG